jgi:twitching motility protein PilT
VASLTAYIDILRQTQADEVRLTPGEPVMVVVAGRGPTQGGAPVSAAALQQLAADLLSPSELREVAPNRPHRTSHEHLGEDYVIDFSRRGSDMLVSLRPLRAVMQRPEPTAPQRPAPQARAPEPGTPIARPPEPTPVPVTVGGSGHAIDDLLRAMLMRKASDLHLSSDNPPILRIDGEIHYLEDRPKLTSKQIHELLHEIAPDKAKHDFAELRDADFAYELAGSARFRVNLFEDRKGVGAVLRQIPMTIISAEQLGLPKACLDLCQLSKGLVVVTGPTGSGKSTTLAAMIDHINRTRTDHIITIEDPVEFVHPNIKCLVNQREVGSHTKSFKNALRAALREDPDIVLVGEMRDLETIAIAIETAETGHLVFGTLHTTTATSTVDRIIDQFPSDRQAQIRVMLSESLKGVIAQVLCKKKGGGRVAAQEVLLGTTAVSAMIREGKTFQLGSVMQTGKAHGMLTMNDALLSLVQRDLIEPKEAHLKAVDKAGLLGAFKNVGLPTSFT